MQQIETKTSTTDWSGSFDRAVTEIFQILGQSIFSLGVGIGELLKLYYRNFLTGSLALVTYILTIYQVVERNLHLKLLRALDDEIFFWLRSKGYFSGTDFQHVAAISVVPLSFLVFCLGFRWMYQRSKEEKIFKLAKLKNANDAFPRVISKIKLENDFLLMKIDPKGLGVTDFESKKDQLEGLFKLGDIEEIRRCEKDQSKIELLFSTARLPELIEYARIDRKQIPKDHFSIGMTKNGMFAQNIAELPHMLIAGMTGSGKSVFFKQVLMSLLESTPKLKMHLIDLKGGLEMNDFTDHPNVNIVSDVKDAVALLEKVKAEMDERFQYLKDKNRKTIDPEKDGKDRIVLGIDECSVLYMKKNKGTKEYYEAIRAREITDDIAKLSRAAGIHLILATQKVTKETIDTSIQDNVAAKVCFKMSGNNASVLVLGNKKAEELPQIRGRAIWHYGQDFIHFQAPLINTDEIKSLCKDMAKKTDPEDKNKDDLPKEEEKQSKHDDLVETVSDKKEEEDSNE